jgi:lysophospholipase L1-like esterase
MLSLMDGWACRAAALTAVALFGVGCSTPARTVAGAREPVAAQPSAAQSSAAPSIAAAASYLALGDSVVFGFRLNASSYKDTAHFVGYPTYVGRQLHLATTNAACPGEATGGFISTTSPTDNGCRFFKSQFGLHVRYAGSQLDFAVGYLHSHPNTQLVTLGLGANDGFLLQRRCGDNDKCLRSGAAPLLRQIEDNLVEILGAIRAAGYRGRILVTNYYSLDYTSTRMTSFSERLNDAITEAARRERVEVVDEFAAVKAAAEHTAHGVTCLSGLLNRISPGPTGCDVHPSTAGQKLLAATIVAAYLRR